MLWKWQKNIFLKILEKNILEYKKLLKTNRKYKMLMKLSDLLILI